jgi:hypothetical protein
MSLIKHIHNNILFKSIKLNETNASIFQFSQYKLQINVIL